MTLMTCKAYVLRICQIMYQLSSNGLTRVTGRDLTQVGCNMGR